MSTASFIERSFLIVVLICRQLLAAAQAPSPPPAFHPPVSHPIRLSGTFGELRTNHFHGGLDIKSSNGAWGDPIYAIEEGYIGRVTVSPGGYGRALYIHHPSGLTSIYAHLQSFSPEVESLVHRNQLDKKSFAIDLDLTKEVFPVFRGQQIGKMGSTGYSFGPHLHLEILHTATGKSLNPQLLNFDISDEIKPVIKQVSIYHLDHKLQAYGQTACSLSQLQKGDTLESNAWRVGFGLEAYDPFNQGQNKNGIYAASVWVDGNLIYRFTFDTINRRDRSYFPLHIDYASRIRDSRKIHRCFRTHSDRLSIHQDTPDDGIVPLFRDRTQNIRLAVADFAGNEDTVSFYIQRSETVSPVSQPPYQYRIQEGKSDTIRTPYLEMTWPSDALYQDLYCEFSSVPAQGGDVYSALYKIHHNWEPLKGTLALKIRPLPVADSLKKKLVIVRVDGEKNHQVNCGGQWKGDWLTSNVNSLGDYLVKADTQPPTIKVIQNRSTAEGRTLIFQIDDNLPGGSGLKYVTTLNDQWILTAYDLKSNRLTCQIDRSEWSKGSHYFKLLVEDTVGNSTTYDYRFNFN